MKRRITVEIVHAPCGRVMKQISSSRARVQDTYLCKHCSTRVVIARDVPSYGVTVL